MTIDDFAANMVSVADNDLMTAVKRFSQDESVGPILDNESELLGWEIWK